jgi:hypothetical protein
MALAPSIEIFPDGKIIQPPRIEAGRLNES